MKPLAWMTDAQFEAFMNVLLTFVLLCVVHTVTIFVEAIWDEPGLGKWMGVFYRRIFHINMDIIAPIVTVLCCVLAALDRMGIFEEV